ncbi:heavy-metal-associated domain-containing protein [Fluviicola taffensis]|uniref:Heavy metal transport/detoxification protein n=1 Tax=Fluviicola taffensis (strain DSM 16823 / NCIMB 13979 / RW262) TaxID=755732 RepID=F2IJI3_FLUTR|nr:heavy-metal-associated domain-containing protein [Fluviicola taffensis]AEA42871.1 Heavy metal transport/detoxification protein [Fluviicola taffensis DSM 16823]
MKNSLLLVVLLVVSNFGFGQKTTAKTETVVIQTSAECDECKERIEGSLNYTKGVKFAELDVPSRKLTVKFKSDVISLEEIKKQISSLGYNADEVLADPTAFEKLPACCKPNGMEKHEEHGGH